jgi:hypothetical protein
MSRTKTSKSQKVAEYFLANPSAKPTEVGKKFKVAMPSVYGIRKRVLSGSMLDQASPVVKQTAKQKQVGGSHYKDMGVQPWDVVDTWTREQQIGYYRGGALKYIMRMGSKDQSATEIAKGKHYLEKLLEVLGG